MTLRHRQLVLLLTLLFSSGAYANCGIVPQPPELLTQAQLSTQEVESLQTQISGYIETVEEYRTCIDGNISQIAPADAPEEYFDSPEYQAEFDAYAVLSETAATNMQIAVDRYNYLLVNSTSAAQ
jgi:hypothetical protein